MKSNSIFALVRSAIPASKALPHLAYRYVEAIDPKDGKRHRHAGGIKEVTHTSSILF